MSRLQNRLNLRKQPSSKHPAATEATAWLDTLRPAAAAAASGVGASPRMWEVSRREWTFARVVV